MDHTIIARQLFFAEAVNGVSLILTSVLSAMLPSLQSREVLVMQLLFLFSLANSYLAMRGARLHLSSPSSAGCDRRRSFVVVMLWLALLLWAYWIAAAFIERAG